ncbi:hypothetical protein [Nonomuraea cavernae]|uniref:hypothetical protein n=1 Tax=Nonomuraea cavernae TaxID=2045107 RepID=UPI0033F70447
MGSKMKRALQVAAIGGIMAGAMVLPATAAQATPSNCSSVPYGNGWSGWCGKGTGTYQVWARCYKINTLKYTIRHGPWRSPGGDRSNVSCQSTEEVGGGGIILS